ncbi:MAG: GH32 C-terminal domain-containing protein [Clostridiales bacterium]|nr:GH32 C-terminal domain-containing protein [Clostridiales bacterium]
MKGKWRQNLHIEPPEGWMNDPNGLCFFDGFYHVYFQYSPGTPHGENTRRWGHFVSPDLLSWKYKGIVLEPDIPEDRDGVFSGSAVTFDDHIEFFYTGNVMEEGDHDYVLEGRGANVIYVSSPDGSSMSSKKVLLRNPDYPGFCSCHVRDPKVTFENGIYKMVLGARTKDGNGCVLFYEGADVDSFEYKGCFSAPDMGYMWECPDVFEISGRKFLAFCPQGIEQGDFRFQNIFQSGYFTFEGSENAKSEPLKSENAESENAKSEPVKSEPAKSDPAEFVEFDYGFDFYAPQTFMAPDGRRLLIGWMGIGDDSYTNPTVEAGWQHCLTLPRELSVDPDGRLIQKPFRELEKIKRSCKKVNGETWEKLPFELACTDCSGDVSVAVSGAEITWNREDGVLSLHFTNGEGCGRTERRIALESLTSLRIIADASSLEIYVNDGRYVMSTRFYPEYKRVRVGVTGASADVYALRLNDTLVAIGEALIDFIPDKTGCEFGEVGAFAPAAGGAPANVCGAYSKLGGKSRMITQLGNDPFGGVITGTLNDAGVDTSYISYTDAANTALAFVSLSKDGNRVFSFYRNPSADMLFAPENVTGEMFEDCYALHFCSVSLGDFPMKDAHRAAVTIARRQGAIVSFDPNLRFMLWDDRSALKKVVWEFLPDCDILKISDEELEFIAGTSSADEAVPLLFTGNVKLVILTKGKDGASAFSLLGSVDSAVPVVKATDTTGAGDAFIGSFLWCLRSRGIGREDLGNCPLPVIKECLDFANRYCSISVQRSGAIPSYPTLEEMKGLRGLRG